MEVTESGMLRLFENPLQFLNAELPIEVMELRMMRSPVKPLQLAKA